LSLQSLLLELPRQRALHEAWERVSEQVYLIASLERDLNYSGYFYHTTSFPSLKCILRDGYLSGKAAEKRAHKATGSMHEGIVAFTTNPMRHLNPLPELAFMMPNSIILDVYLRWPLKVLLDLGVKPVAYKLNLHEIRKLPPSCLQNLLNEERLEELYGGDPAPYIYATWIDENEWRIATEKFTLPKETEVYVSSPQQLRAVEKLSRWPVFLDANLQAVKVTTREPELLRKVRKAMHVLYGCGDNIQHALSKENDLPRMKVIGEDYDRISGMINRARTILREKNRHAAEQWLKAFQQSSWLVQKWRKLPIG